MHHVLTLTTLGRHGRTSARGDAGASWGAWGTWAWSSLHAVLQGRKYRALWRISLSVCACTGVHTSTVPGGFTTAAQQDPGRAASFIIALGSIIRRKHVLRLVTRVYRSA